jgi:hypothetical protein
LVKIISRTGEEEKFDSKDVESQLKAAGLPERVAEEVAERVEDRVEDRWTTTQVNEQVDIELKRLEEDIERAHNSIKTNMNTMTNADRNREDMNRNETIRSETFVPEKNTRSRY